MILIDFLKLRKNHEMIVLSPEEMKNVFKNSKGKRKSE
jgi:hypothetical protein